MWDTAGYFCFVPLEQRFVTSINLTDLGTISFIRNYSSDVIPWGYTIFLLKNPIFVFPNEIDMDEYIHTKQ